MFRSLPGLVMLLFLLVLPLSGFAALDSLTNDEAAALVKIVRNRLEADAPVPAELPARLSEPGQPPLIVTLYGGTVQVQRTGTKSTLAESAAEAAVEIAGLLAKVPDSVTQVREGRIALDVIVSREPIVTQSLSDYVSQMDPGIEGLECLSGRHSVFLTPVSLMRSIAILRSAYVAQESELPPSGLTAERIRTASFVEETPGGRVVTLLRGNVLLPLPYAENLLQATLRAAAWMLRNQQPDGSFFSKYFPVEQKTDPDYPLADHLRGVIALTILQQLTGDARFEDAATRALQFVINGSFVKQELREGLLYVPAGKEKDDVTCTALLLTVLCQRAIADAKAAGKPTASAQMVQLGKALCVMTAPDGKLRMTLSGARSALVSDKAPPCFVRGPAYPEALLALSLLQRISPTEDGREAADRLANYMIFGTTAAQFVQVQADGPDVGQLTGDRRTVGRVVDALAEYWRLTRSDAHAETAFKYAHLLAGSQIVAEKTRFPDFVGGVGESEHAPDVSTTAATLSGLCSAYELALLTRQPDKTPNAPDTFAPSVRTASRFLLNMQYRPVNTYFLPNRESVLGAFRRCPEDLTVSVDWVADCVRALMAATTIVAETVPMEGAQK